MNRVCVGWGWGGAISEDKFGDEEDLPRAVTDQSPVFLDCRLFFL